MICQSVHFTNVILNYTTTINLCVVSDDHMIVNVFGMIFTKAFEVIDRDKEESKQKI